MASSVIHMCVADVINKKLNRDYKKVLIGSIAPDLSKLIGRTKIESHFIDNADSIPNLEEFLKKYQKYLKDDYVLGYYIHLYTDYIWFKYFLKDFVVDETLYKLDGSTVDIGSTGLSKYFYNDYDNSNKLLVKKYNLDLNFFYEKLPHIKEIITEIPINQIQILVDKTKYHLEKSQATKATVFDEEEIDKFINNTANAIMSNLEDIGYIKN